MSIVLISMAHLVLRFVTPDTMDTLLRITHHSTLV